MNPLEGRTLVLSDAPKQVLARAVELPEGILLKDGRRFGICVWRPTFEAGKLVKIDMTVEVSLPTEEMDKLVAEAEEG